MDTDSIVALCLRGDIDECKRVFLAGGDNLLRIKGNNGISPLHCAAYRGNLELVEFLLSLGHAVDVINDKSWTPLHEACHWRHFDVVQQLIVAGASVNALTQARHTPLHIACQRDDVSCIRILTRCGTILDAVDNEGNSPLALCHSMAAKVTMRSALTQAGLPHFVPKNLEIPSALLNASSPLNENIQPAEQRGNYLELTPTFGPSLDPPPPPPVITVIESQLQVLPTQNENDTQETVLVPGNTPPVEVDSIEMEIAEIVTHCGKCKEYGEQEIVLQREIRLLRGALVETTAALQATHLQVEGTMSLVGPWRMSIAPPPDADQALQTWSTNHTQVLEDWTTSLREAEESARALRQQLSWESENARQWEARSALYQEIATSSQGALTEAQTRMQTLQRHVQGL